MSSFIANDESYTLEENKLIESSSGKVPSFVIKIPLAAADVDIPGLPAISLYETSN